MRLLGVRTTTRRARRAAVMTVPAVMLAACAAIPVSLMGSPSPSATTADPTPSAVLSTLPPTPTPRPTPTAAPQCTPATALSTWTVERLAWQVITVPAQATGLSAVRTEVTAGAGGILLFGTTAPLDLRAQLARLSPAGSIPPLVMTDMEGGDVQRAANLVGALPSARRMAETMTAAQIRSLAAAAARRMRAAGILMDLAPVADLDAGVGPNAVDPDGTRSFSANPAVAAADAAAFAEGLRDGGVAAAVKHFPGLHGSGDNTDAGPGATLPWTTLQHGGLVPFATAIDDGVPAVMLSNASVPGLTALPASISPAAVDALRRGLGFRGLIVTDSLSAGALVAIHLSVAQAATDALVAGADMVLYNGAARDVAANASTTVAAIVAAVASGRLPRAQLAASVARILAVKGVDPCAGSH